jgi:hypothetical protein
MSAENWTVTEVLLAGLSIILLISTLIIGILLSNLAREISKGQSKLHSLLTSIDVRIREISEAIIALRLDMNADRDKEELTPKSKSRNPW